MVVSEVRMSNSFFLDNMPYPPCLAEALEKYGRRPTGNVEWDRAVLSVCKKNNRETAEPWLALGKIVEKCQRGMEDARLQSYALNDSNVYEAHCKFLLYVANEIILKPQRRQFVIDDNNRQVLRFLLYYFNGSPLCEEVFPDAGYKMHKNLLLMGGVGVGKTLLMQIFSEYLRLIGSPRYFHNLSVTQMVNYYTINNNLDRFTYFEEESRGFLCKPENVCLNDIGIQDKTFYGMNTALLTDEFLHARNEIWTQFGKFAHLTTNLDKDQLIARFNLHDKHHRLVDRFKTYNVIPLTGGSRR